MRTDTIQTNFTAGEISPLLHGRPDINRYANGAKKLRNFLVRPQGGLTRRRGTVFISETKDSSKKSRLYRFQFSVSQVYILEFGNLYVRIFRNDAFLFELTTLYSEADLPRLSFCQSADILFISHPKYRTQKLSRYADDNWTITGFMTTDGPYSSVAVDGISVKLSDTVDTAYLTSSNPSEFASFTSPEYVEFRYQEQWRLGLIQSKVDDSKVQIKLLTNVLLGTDQNKLVAGTTSPTVASYTRTSPVTYTKVPSAGVVSADHSDVFTSHDVGKRVRVTGGGWYLITGFTGISGSVQQVTTSTPALVLRSVTGILTLSERVVRGNLTATSALFQSTDVGRHIRLNYFSAQTWGEITSFTSDKLVSVSLYEDVPLSTEDPASGAEKTKLSNDGVTDDFKLGAWSDTTGWPAVMTFHEQRAVFARTNSEPQSIWMSKSSDYINFAPSDLDSQVQDTSAITFTIATNEANEIAWLSSGQTLLIGTVAGEWQAKPDSKTGDALTPTNIRVQPQTYNGSRPELPPVRADSSILFVQLGARKLLDMAYEFSIDSFSAKDATIISEHILSDGGGAVALAYHKEPHSVLWVVRADGKLAGMTYEKEQEVFAWHLHEIGGEDAKVESVITIPSADLSENTLYLIVNRLVAGVQKRYIERIESDSKDHYLDSSLSYMGPPSKTFSGLGHLEGEVVSIMADGSYYGTAVVNTAKITLDVKATEVSVGLPYQSLMAILPPEGGNPLGTAQGKIKRMHASAVRLLNSLEFKYGPTEDELDTLPFRDTANPMGQPVPLFSGVKEFDLDSEFDLDATLVIVQDMPYPLNILSLMHKIKVNEQ